MAQNINPLLRGQKGIGSSDPRTPKGYNQKNYAKGKKQPKLSGKLKRQTYIGRNYDGKNGHFLPSQKVLLRYNTSAVFDRKFIHNLIDKIENLKKLQDRFDMETLKYGKKICEQALWKYTPADTGYLRSRWKVEIDQQRMKLVITNDCEYVNAMEHGKHGEPNGITSYGAVIYAWYPGYYMLAKTKHETRIKMREFALKKQRELKSRARNGR